MSFIGEILFKNCPFGVEFKTIDSVIFRPLNIKWEDKDSEEFKYIDLTSVNRATHAISETTVINKNNAPSRAQQIVHEGDVIFGTTRPMLKRYAVVSSDFDGQVCSTGFCVLRPNENYIMTNFLFHLLGTTDFLFLYSG